MYEVDNLIGADNQVPANARSESFWASSIRESWQKSAAGIIETGKLLLQAREELDRGVFSAMTLRLPFGPRTAQRLMAIARHPVLSNPTHVSAAPPSWGTLYELSKLPNDILLAKLEDGTIHAGVERKDVARAVQDIPALNRGDAAELADRIIDGLIDALRRNPAMPVRSHDDWLLLLAEQRVRTAEQIAKLVNGCVGLDEVLNTIEAVW